MKHIIGMFAALFMLMLNISAGAAVITVSADVAAAMEYKASVVAEIENSNFNPNVIAGCIAQAKQAGYELEVRESTYDARRDLQAAEVLLTYSYRIPLLGINGTKTTRAAAR